MGLKLGAAGVIAGLLVVGMITGSHWLGRHTGPRIDRRAEQPGPGSSAPASLPAPRAGAWVTTPVPRVAAARPVDAVPARLGPYGVRQATGSGSVALTFDDGPDPRWTPAILDLLRQHGATATFCLVGANVEAFPDLIRRIVSDGHTLCNHTWAHEVALGTWSTETIRANLTRVNNAIRRALPGAAIPYFRHPGGAWTPRAVQVAASLGMASIHWDVDPQDWRRPGVAAIARSVTAGTRPGSIILLHDGGGDRSGTIAACRFFLPFLRDRFSLLALPTPPANGIGRGRYQVPD